MFSQFQLSESGPAIVPTLNIADLPDDIIGDLPDISGDATTGENTDIALTIQGDKAPATAMPPPPPPPSTAPPPPPPAPMQ